MVSKGSKGSTAMRCAAELGELMIEQFETIPPYLYVYSDGGPERKTDNLSVQKSYIALFLLHNFEEILIARTAANLSYRNPVERVHAIANLGLQSVGLMRKAMPQNMENVIRNSNSNDEIRKLCSKNSDLEIELKKSLDQPKRPIDDVFKELSQKGKKIEIFQSVTQDKIDTCNNILLNNFDENILMLSLRAHFTKSKYPKLHEFYTKHCVSRTYYFHVFKCSELDCPWH